VPSVDLNADVGEAPAPDGGGPPGSLGVDGALLDTVTSASVACGFHAGDPGTMRHTVEEAARRGVVVGAHPSYLDRTGFGRRPLDIAPAQVAAEVVYQVGALDALARAAGTRVRYVKAHGALYHRMAVDEACARAVIDALRSLGGLVVLVPPGSVALEVAGSLGVPAATEAFADRAYLADGRLADRGTPGAVLTDADEVAGRAVALARDHRVTAVDGTEITVRASSICVHGDTPGAASLARSVRRALEAAGVTLAPFAAGP